MSDHSNSNSPATRRTLTFSHGTMATMPATAIDSPATSYATPARQRGYIQAMRQIAIDRPIGTPVRVYVSVAPRIKERPRWDARLEAIRGRLPEGVELLTYETAFPSDTDYPDQWTALAPQLDGLIVIAPQKKPGGAVFRVGPVARKELRDLAGAKKPVLLHTWDWGLVPLVDCLPNRTGKEGKEHLKLSVPRGWDRKAPGPTLAAALDALRPVTSGNSGMGDSEPSV